MAADLHDPAADQAFLLDLHRGTELLRTGQLEEARANLERACGLRPGDPQGLNQLGLLHFQLGNFARARDLFTGLVERYPREPSLRVNLGLAWLRLGVASLAGRELEEALALAPGHRRATAYLALALARMGRLDASIAHFRRAGFDRLASRIAEVKVAREADAKAEQGRASAITAIETELLGAPLRAAVARASDSVADAIAAAAEAAAAEVLLPAEEEAPVAAEAVPEAVPEAVAEAVPEAVPETVAEAVPEAVPEAVAEAAPEAAADSSPEVAAAIAATDEDAAVPTAPGVEVTDEAILEVMPVEEVPWAESGGEVEEALARAADRYAGEAGADAGATEVAADAILEESPVEPSEEPAPAADLAAPVAVGADDIAFTALLPADDGAPPAARAESDPDAPPVAVTAEAILEEAPADPAVEPEAQPEAQLEAQPKPEPEAPPATSSSGEVVIAYSASSSLDAASPPSWQPGDQPAIAGDEAQASALDSDEPTTLELMPEDLISAEAAVAEGGAGMVPPPAPDFSAGSPLGLRALAPPLPGAADAALVPAVPAALVRTISSAALAAAGMGDLVLPAAVASGALLAEAAALSGPFPAGAPALAALPRGGSLISVRVDGIAYARARLVVATEGNLSFEPLSRRRHGRSMEEVMGGGDAVCRVEGNGLITLGGLGSPLLMLELEDQRMYMREAVVAAFDERLLWESGGIRMDGEVAEPMLHVRGSGQVVLRTRRPLVALPVKGGSVTRTRAAAVAGWLGNVVPTPAASPLELGGARTSLEFHGEGAVLCHDLAGEP